MHLIPASENSDINLHFPLLTHLTWVFPQYRETYEVLRDDPKTEGVNVKDYAKMAIRNLLHANSCVHSRRFIAEFPQDG